MVGFLAHALLRAHEV